jgi:hypothetical protein
MDNKYLKYKIKYLQLKNQIGGVIDIKYHGSPFKLTEIQTHSPRGDNDFNTQTGVYLTSNKIQAMLYSIARDKKRINKGWSIYKSYLFLVKEHWDEKYWNNTPIEKRYKLNNKGYLYFVNCSKYKCEQNPYLETEYIIKNNIIPDKIITVTINDIKNNIIYITKNDFKTMTNEDIINKYKS